MKIFSIDSPLMIFLGKAADILILNILYIVCSLPIITIGATTTAAYTVTKTLKKGEEISIIKDFFIAFKNNFKTSTLSWLIVIFIGCILVIDFQIASQLPGSLKDILRIIVVMLGIIYLFTLLYLFQYIATFQNKLFTCFKNSILLSIAKLPYSLLFLAIILFSIGVTYILGLGITGSFWTLFGFELIIYLTNNMYVRIFDSINFKKA